MAVRRKRGVRKKAAVTKKVSTAKTKQARAKKAAAKRRTRGAQPPNQKRVTKNTRKKPEARKLDSRKPIAPSIPHKPKTLPELPFDPEAVPQLTAPELIARQHPGLDLCPACRELRPLEEFMGVESDMSGAPGPPPACSTCREKGLPHRMPVPQIHPTHLRILAMHASGSDGKTIAREVQVHESTVSQIVSGVRGAVAREAFMALLEMHGLDDRTVALGLLRGLYATKMQYSKSKDDFVEFADEGVRLKAVSLLTKLRQLEPPNAASEKPGPRKVIIRSSLFDAEHEEGAVAGENRMGYKQTAKGAQVEVEVDG